MARCRTARIWDESAAVEAPPPDAHIYVEKARLLPNGDLLALYVAIGTSPWGMGLVRLNQDGEVVWKYLAQAHHDFDVGPDGRIYVLTHEIRDDPVPGHQHLAPPRIDDYAVVLSPDGEELQKVWLLGALADSPYASVLSTVPWYIAEGKGDYLHTNSIDVVTAEQAANAPFAATGQVLLSLREVGADRAARPGPGAGGLGGARPLAAPARRGPAAERPPAAVRQRGRARLHVAGARARPGDPGDHLELCRRRASIRSTAGCARRRSGCPNGNTLITESDGGRLLEVTPSGRDRVGIRQPGARRGGRRAGPDRLLGPADRPGGRSSRASARF